MSLNNDTSQFDKLFEETFKNASAPAPAGVWEAVAAQTTGAASGAASTTLLSKLAGASLQIKTLVATVLIAAVVTTAVLLQSDDNNLPVNHNASEQNDTPKTDDNDVNKETLNPLAVKENSKPDEDQAAQPKEAPGSALQNPMEKAGKEQPLNQAPVSNPSSKLENNNVGVKADNRSQLSPESKTIQTSYNLSVQLPVVCANQTNQVWIQPVPSKGNSTMEWMLNNQRIPGNQVTQMIHSSKLGSNVVSVRITEANGREVVKEARFEVQGFDSDFASEFLQQEQMYFVTSKTVANKHQWFENGNKLSAETANIRVQASDKTSTNLMHIAENEGCSDTTVKILRSPSQCDEEVEIPSVFTPYEKDNLNDEFVISGYHGVDAYTLLIYSSDGRRMFQAENSSQNWDGKDPQTGRLAPVGWYNYTLVLSCNGESKKRYGKILLAE